MEHDIIRTAEFARSLEEKYNTLRVPTYKLRSWFAVDRKVFFDCDRSDKVSCLLDVLAKRDFSFFRVYFLVRDVASDSYRFMDVSFRNLGRESLEHFINRYHLQLEPVTRLSLQGAALEYIECEGYGYE
jgi:hypothetical protein